MANKLPKLPTALKAPKLGKLTDAAALKIRTKAKGILGK